MNMLLHALQSDLDFGMRGCSAMTSYSILFVNTVQAGDISSATMMKVVVSAVDEGNDLI
jgi:hypothetical protein